MTRRRFFAPPSAISAENKIITLDQAETRHLRDVLRLREGDDVFVFDGQGREFRCEVTEATAKSGTLGLIEASDPARPESPLQLTLAMALLKGEKFDLVVQKATELGVTRIVPVLAARSDVRIANPAGAAKRVDRWNRLALEAAKQSGRAFVPVCENPLEFGQLVVHPGAERSLRVLFTEREGASSDDIVESRPQTVVALIGPEGGWSDEELELARQNDWTLITFGGRIMRAETAAIAITALLQHRYGDMN